MTVHFLPSYFFSESPWPATFENPRPTAAAAIRARPAASSGGWLSLASQAPPTFVTIVGLLKVTVWAQLQAALVVGSTQPAGAAAERLTSKLITHTSVPRPASPMM